MPHLTSVRWDVLGRGPWPAPTLPHAPVPLPAQCDLLIVGAGITGLSAARALARFGHRPVVVDRAFGTGATARSGGVIVGDTLVGAHPDFEGCEFDLRDWIDEQHVPCGLTWTGCAELVRNDRDARRLGWNDSGELAVQRVVHGGVVEPAALVTAAAASAFELGATVLDNVTVDRWNATNGGVLLETSAGPILAERVLMATDASAKNDTFDAWPARMFTVVLETEPVSDAIADAIGWSGRVPFYTSDLPLLWGRPLPQQRMMIGRELVAGTLDGDELDAAVQRAGDRLVARVRGLHRALSEIGIRRIWAGPIARDATGLPGIHPDPVTPNVWWAGGYGGHGLAQAFRLGTRAGAVLHRRQ